MRTPRPAVRTRRGGSVVLAALLVVLVAGCGAEPGPRVWATAVCQALSPWRAEIGTLTSRTQQQMTAGTTPAQAKENLARLFAGARAASEAARGGVERAGVPDVAGGDAVASGFLGSLTAVRDAYGRAESSIVALNTTSADVFYAEVGKVVETLDAEYRRSALDTSKLNSEELRRAFDEVPECR